MKTLVIEDEMIIAMDLELSIELTGNECVGIASSLDQAMNLMTDEVKIVFMDINLNSKENGIEIAEILRNNFDFYLVFVSASYNQLFSEKTKMFDNCEFIKKPFHFNSLRQVIENAKKLY